MDSEQMQHRLNLENAMVGAEFRTPQESNSSLHHSPLEPQITTQQGESTADSGMSSDETWKIESAQQERKLLMAIEDIKKTEIDDKLEFKKYLAELYKQSNSLMTIYNQRVQNLLLDDRFLHRHTNEISALLIRGLMPPLEEVKSIEKSLTSTRKKAKEETIDQQTSTAVKEMQKVEAICKDVKSRIIKYTRAPKPVKIAKKTQDKPLDQHAISLQNAIKQVNPAPFQQKAEVPVSKNTLLSTENLNLKARQEAAPKEPESIKSKQLKVLVDNLLPSDTGQNEKIQRLIEQEYQKYSALQSFLSVARQKCNLLGMRADKVCVACESALSKLDSFRSGSSFTMNELLAVDKAIQTLERFDKKLPGEVWQLLTELKPSVADHRHHLLNLQCRKLLMDGPATMTQKSEIKHFCEVERYLNLLTENASEKAIDDQFTKVFGDTFTSASQCKKGLSIANKPQELQALITNFETRNFSEIAIFAKKAKEQQNEKYVNIFNAGVRAYEYITSDLHNNLQNAAINFRLSEPDVNYKKMTETLLARFKDYLEARDFIGTPTKLQQPPILESNDKSSEVTICIEALLYTLGETNQKSPNLHIKNLITDLDAIANDLKNGGNSFHNRERNLINALLTKELAPEVLGRFLPEWLRLKSIMTKPSAHNNSKKPSVNQKEISKEFIESLPIYEENRASKWLKQIFNASTKDQHMLYLGIAKTLIPICICADASYEIKKQFINSLSNRLREKKDDSYLTEICNSLDKAIISIT
ncbi:hypothetical protein [Endozoicomonas ascidiicola]|uniref:hypothetical protein n=1 Tax=Endozoicomonas ascidiicola TaxID=1698521 RepID=UPI0008308161|nr:hypothetical protein [Endozoicomonas ascidiicola]